MTDLEMVKKCAERMGFNFDLPIEESDFPKPHNAGARVIYAEMMAAKKAAYDPLHDDAQATALVKKFRLNILGHNTEWKVVGFKSVIYAENLNRAIVECVANMPPAS